MSLGTAQHCDKDHCFPFVMFLSAKRFDLHLPALMWNHFSFNLSFLSLVCVPFPLPASSLPCFSFQLWILEVPLPDTTLGDKHPFSFPAGPAAHLGRSGLLSTGSQITASLELEGTSGDHLAQLNCQSRLT